MFFSRKRTSSTLLLKRVPRHSSQSSSTSARNCISTVTVPSPWQVSQRPPGMLKEKWPGREAAPLGLRRAGEDFADGVKGLEVGGGIRARRASDGRLIHQDDGGQMIVAFDALAEMAEIAARALDLQRLVENVVNERGFAGAGNAGDGDQLAQRNHDVNILQVVGARAADAQEAAGGLAATGRHGDAQLAAQIAGRERLRRGQKLRAGTGEEDVAAEFAGARAEIENVVGGGNDVGIVLDDQDGVAEIAQALEDFDEAMRVARVQADGRLVEHVERADQMRAERGGQLNALRFAAGKRGGQPIEREVVEADFVEKAQALADFFQDFVGDGGALRAERELGEELARLGDRHGADIGDGFILHAHGARFRTQARAAAFRAQRVAAIAAEKDAHVELVLLALEPGEEALHAGIFRGAIAFDDGVALRGGELAKRNIQGNLALLSEASSARAHCARKRGLVQGSMAPCWMDLPGSGMTRSRSKSIVLPKPWQRGQAPKGLLKENRRGSGSW